MQFPAQGLAFQVGDGGQGRGAQPATRIGLEHQAGDVFDQEGEVRVQGKEEAGHVYPAAPQPHAAGKGKQFTLVL